MNKTSEPKSPEPVELGLDKTTKAISLAYEKPVLICYGDVRDITLGPSPGVGESAGGLFLAMREDL